MGFTAGGRVGQGAEVLCYHGVGNHADGEWVQRGTKDGVLFAGVGNADDVVDIAERKLQQLVRQYARCICESEERMICKHRP